jgi:hypothetical protein
MSYNPERTLWQEVLNRQVDDALHGPASIYGLTKRTKAVEEARTFLTTPSKNLAQLCSMAGLDMGAVIPAMLKRINEAPTAHDLAANRNPNRCTFSKRPEKERKKVVPVADRELTLNGETLTRAQWAERTGLTLKTIGSRLHLGWTVERTLTQPIGKRSGDKRNKNWGYTGATSNG